MNKIISARITEIPKRLGDPLPEVWATFSDGTEKMILKDRLSSLAENRAVARPYDTTTNQQASWTGL